MTKSEASFEKVIDVAFDLFLENGYDKTTIRMITDKAGIHIGSLYYIFENKESLLKAVSLTIYDAILKNALTLSGNNLAVMMYPAASMLYMGAKSPKMGKLLYQSFSTWPVFHELLKFSQNWALNYYQISTELTTYQARLLFIFGGLGNMIGEIVHTECTDWWSKLEQFMSISFQIFNSDMQMNIEETKALIRKKIENEKIILMGKEISWGTNL